MCMPSVSVDGSWKMWRSSGEIKIWQVFPCLSRVGSSPADQQITMNVVFGLKWLTKYVKGFGMQIMCCLTESPNGWSGSSGHEHNQSLPFSNAHIPRSENSALNFICNTVSVCCWTWPVHRTKAQIPETTFRAASQHKDAWFRMFQAITLVFTMRIYVQICDRLGTAYGTLLPGLFKLDGTNVPQGQRDPSALTQQRYH